MGKLTGFLEFKREVPHGRSPEERVRDWDESPHVATEAQLATQGARCMNCGTPFCQAGKVISGLAANCPINNLIPDWNDLVYRGQ